MTSRRRKSEGGERATLLLLTWSRGRDCLPRSVWTSCFNLQIHSTGSFVEREGSKERTWTAQERRHPLQGRQFSREERRGGKKESQEGEEERKKRASQKGGPHTSGERVGEEDEEVSSDEEAGREEA